MSLKPSTAHIKKPVRSAADFVPPGKPDIHRLCAAAENCRGCELYKNARHLVFGEGAPQASVMLVGEQPGANEDDTGRPFVGRAGALLNEMLVEAGLKREEIYITSAVKHFYFEPRGKRRIGITPLTHHVQACRPWLVAQIDAIGPRVIVAMGRIAGLSLLQKNVTIGSQRGTPLAFPQKDAIRVLLTYHPAAILRNPSAQAREEHKRMMIADFRQAAKLAARPKRMVH
jgi:DNA polymerase